MLLVMTEQSTTINYLRSILSETASVAAQGCAYHTSSNRAENGSYQSGWTADFAHKELNEVWRDLDGPLRRGRNRRITVSELKAIDQEDLYSIGFRRWDDKLIMIPLWALNYIADGQCLINISGITTIKGTDKIDLDVRAGCVAYGFLSVKEE
jgi:hypothetical protein